MILTSQISLSRHVMSVYPLITLAISVITRSAVCTECFESAASGEQAMIWGVPVLSVLFLA